MAAHGRNAADDASATHKGSGPGKAPDFDSLEAWQKVEFTDSTLRYAEEQVRRGNTTGAVKLYMEVLKEPAEHLQCAALIGLGKANTPEAAAILFTKLHDKNNTVRITAAKAWAAMAK